MSKFNLAATKPAVFSPITSTKNSDATTFEGGTAFARDLKSELFILAVSNLVSENTFYENGKDRDNRYVSLIRQAAIEDPEWTAHFLAWLRTEANLRSASLVGAAEYVKARLDAIEEPPPALQRVDAPGKPPTYWTSEYVNARRKEEEAGRPTNRQVIDSVLQRADEPGELLAYWTSNYGKRIPKPVKRGIADAVTRLYRERSYIKQDSAKKGYRFSDVLNLVHPSARTERQSVLFQHILDTSYGRDVEIPSQLEILHARAELLAIPVEQRRELLHSDGAAGKLRAAGMTWESVAGWLQGPLDAKVWEAIIPSMGYMALLRNLRNFDQAGVSDLVAEKVAGRLADPDQVAQSRQLPLRFLSAYNAAPSLRWAWPLEKALNHCLANIPALSGETLIMVDTSGSMDQAFSRDGSLHFWDAAVVFGLALASRANYADVVSYSGSHQGQHFPLKSGESLLAAVKRWKNDGFFFGGGTATAYNIRRHLRPGFHNRVIVLTDEQSSAQEADHVVPNNIPVYTWNLAGYQYGNTASGTRNRHTFGGLNDQSFKLISLLEAGQDASWPF